MIAEGSLFIVAAPSGCGKTSLIRALLDQLNGIEVSVSHTTRLPRSGEVNGQDYYFVDTARFEMLIEQQQFLEYAKVFDHYYGTSLDAVTTRLLAGIDVVLEIDWQGARQVRERMPRCRSVFILPPSLESLRQRLHRRGQDDERVIARRMCDAVSEISHYAEFDFLIVNDDFERSLDALRAIFVAQRQRRATQRVRYRQLLAELLS